MPDEFLQQFLVEKVPLNTPFPAAKYAYDASAYEEEDCDLTPMSYEGIASIRRVRVEMGARAIQG